MSNPLTKGLRPTHPGEILREDTFPALGRPKAEIARLLGISRRTLYDLLGEKAPITPQMALRIAKLTGTEAETWLSLQQMHDLRIAELERAGELKQIPRLEAPAAG
jgi:antitoxin HigA-1